MDTKTLLSFFDVRKKFERITLADGRKLEEPDDPNAWDAVLAPPTGQTAESRVGQDASQPYYVQYQQRELEANRRRQAEEPSADARISGGLRHRLSGAHSIAGSHMTGIEAASSIGGASHVTPNAERPAIEDLLSKYNFDHVGLEAGPKLPIWGAKEAIVNTINNNQVTIVSGYTGCGKTTQIPQFILNHAAHNRKYVNIVVTQPRRIAAKTVAKRVCTERNWPLGKLVGYKIGLDKEFSSPDTRLLYCTTGMLKKMIISKKHLHDWTHIILDEVHEREQDMDFALLLCKKLLNTNSLGVKLILMSATLNSSKLEDYFTREIHGVSFMEKPGRYEIKANHSRHQVTEIYLDRLVKYYPKGFDEPDMQDGPRLHDANIQLCKVILEQLERLDAPESQDKSSGNAGSVHKHAVLVFLPGEAEIMRVKRVLEGGSKAKELGWVIHVLHSKVPLDLIELAFQVTPPGYRKVILATNVAESSITIPDIKYIVDFCLTKILVTDPVTHYVSLKLEFADKNSCIQRMGRAGRVSSGRVYRLVRKSFFEECLENSHRPEMQRAPLDKIILETKQLDFGAPKELLALALDPPDLNNITKTVMTLKVIGALLTTCNGKPVIDDGDLTPLGEMIVTMPVDVRLAKLIILGQLFNVLDETIVVAACVSQKSIFATPLEEKIAAYSCKMRWAQRTFSDCFAALYAFTTWKKHVQEGYFQNPSRKGEYKRQLEWCQQRYLQLKVLQDVDKTIEELKVSLQNVGISSEPMPNRPILTWAEKVNPLHFAIFGAFYPNYFFQRHGVIDQREVHKDLNGRSPMHSLYFTGFPIQQAKFGAIYADQVKALFEPCSIPPEKIHVEFESSRVVVQFTPSLADQRSQEDTKEKRFGLRGLHNDLNLTGEIIPQVYVAMKLKPLGRQFRGRERDNLALAVYDDSIAQRLDRAQRKRKSRGCDAKEEGISAMEIGQIPPPSVAVSTLPVSLVFANTPNCFFVHLRTRDASKEMQDVDDAIEFAVRTDILPSPQIIYNLKIGNIYVASYSEPGVDEVLFYRVRLDSILTSDGNEAHHGVLTQMNPEHYQVKVFYIDYGNMAIKSAKELRLITRQVAKTCPNLVKRAQALECTLTGLKANPTLNQGLWTQPAIDLMVQLEDTLDLEADIYSVVGRPNGPLVSVTLYGNDRRYCVNDVLKQPLPNNKPALAVETGESFLSESNHENRARSHLFSEEIVAQFDAGQVCFWKDGPGGSLSDQKIVEDDDDDDDDDSELEEFKLGKEVLSCHQRWVHLKGPFHPLETKLNGVTRIGSRKEVRIDPDSVNSIFLDQTPNDTHDTWVVAGFVGLTPDGEKIQARSTSCLPNQPGLGSLLTMIFAPCVEMRCDRKVQSYTGALCGLGYRPQNWDQTDDPQKPTKLCSYHPDQDIELCFDVHFDNEDVHQMNKVRYFINRAFTRDQARYGSRNDGTKSFVRMQIPQELIKIQDAIAKHMTNLTNRSRISVIPRHFGHEFRWLEWPAHRLMHLPKVMDTSCPIFKLIRAYQLNEDQKQGNGLNN